jgi:hypothetical protein
MLMDEAAPKAAARNSSRRSRSCPASALVSAYSASRTQMFTDRTQPAALSLSHAYAWCHRPHRAVTAQNRVQQHDLKPQTFETPRR